MNKACMDCKHVRIVDRGPVCMRFGKEFQSGFDPVYGPRMNLSAPDCKVARAEDGQCGPTGRSFKPRPGTAAYDDFVQEELDKIDRQQRADAGRIIITEPPQDTRPWWRRLLEAF